MLKYYLLVMSMDKWRLRCNAWNINYSADFQKSEILPWWNNQTRPTLPSRIEFGLHQVFSSYVGPVPTFFYCRCVLFMWLFSDLHALEVELWIHCFCTRLPPFESSESYPDNLCPVWRFSVMTCFPRQPHFRCIHSHVQDKQISVDTWLNTVWNLDWICFFLTGSGNFTHQCFRLRWICRVGCWSHVPGLLFTAPVCVLDTKQYGVTNLWNRISSSQATFMGFLHHLIFCWVILYCLWCSDPDLGHLSL